MSAPLMQRIAFRVLPPHQKSVLLVLANYAHEDGTGARPALTTLAAWTGRSLGRTKVAVRELRARGLIVPTRRHAPQRPVEYTLVLGAIDALPLARRGPSQQLELFPPDSGPFSRYAQGEAAEAGTNMRFPQSSTGVHRSLATSIGIAGDTRSGKRSGYKAMYFARARETGVRR